MTGSEQNCSSTVPTARIKLPGGYSGPVALSDSRGNRFSRMDWTRCLAMPERLLEDYEKVLKKERLSCVVVKDIKLSGRRLKVVLKQHRPGWSFVGVFRSLRPGRALRNFRAAVKLVRVGIPTAWPLAAIHKRKFLLTTASMYITEYAPNSVNLYNFAATELKNARCDLFEVKKDLCAQAVEIFASLHKLGLWHRDAKATNFIVCKDTDKGPKGDNLHRPMEGQYRLKLIDMDGIKRYFIRRRSNQLRPLWRLAASVMGLVNQTDLLRAFRLYCELTGFEQTGRREVFRKLALLANKKATASKKRKAKDKKQNARYENILIIKPSSLGDIVLALPALSALRKSFPCARINWLVRPEFAQLLENHPHLDRVISFDRKFLGTAWRDFRALRALFLLIRLLRQSRFDAVFDLQGLLRTALLAWLSGCRNRFGMAKAREFAYLFYNHKVEQSKEQIHLVDYYARIIAAAGALPGSVEFVLPGDDAAERRAGRLLAAHGADVINYAVFVPSSAHRDKCWPIENFAVLADRVSSRFGLSIIAVGTEPDKPITDRFRRFAGGLVIDFAGLTGIVELVALLRGARLVVSNDTGPGHVAGALGVPLVLIFGRTNPARVAPYGRPETIVAVEPEKRAMGLYSTEPRHRIEAVMVDQVYQKVCEQMAWREARDKAE